MDERRDAHQNAGEETPSTSHTSHWLIAAVVVLIVALGLAVAYNQHQQSASNQLASREAQMSATISDLQGQIDSLNGKLNQATTQAAQANDAQVAAESAAAKRRTAAESKHIKQLQSQLSDQQKQLKDTQDQMAAARSDLEGNISSTRDELNGSIARTHDELVALEQKGERNYYEFDLRKSKRFQREGPVMLALSKADAKHKHYDLAMVVDDNHLTKKNVNLYEPVWISGSDMAQLQVVVNKVDKDHIHGYVSAPKYAQSATLTPVSSRTDSSSSTSTSSSAPATDAAGTNTSSSPTTGLPQ